MSKNDYNKESDPERKIFQAALGSMTIQPSEKFWNSALHNVINKSDAQSRKRARSWKYVAFGMGGVIALLCVHDVLMSNKIDKIEEQNTEIVSLQKKLVELESKPVNTVAAVNANAVNTESNNVVSSGNNTSQSTAAKVISRINNNATNTNANKIVALHAINKSVVSNTYTSHKDIVSNATKPNSVSTNVIASNQTQSVVNSVAPEVNKTNVPVLNNTSEGSVVAESSVNKSDSLITKSSVQISENQDAPMTMHADSSAKTINVADSINNVNAAVAQATKKSFSLKHRGSIGAFFAPGGLNDFYEDRDNDMTDNITPKTVKARQNDWFSYETGVNLGLDITKKLTVRTGLYYNAYSYEIKQTVVKAQTEENGQLGYSIVTSSGLVNIPYTASSVKPGDSIKVRGSSSRGYICVPLQLTYQFFTHYKFGLFADAGIAANIAASTSTQLNWQNTTLQEGNLGITSIEGLQQIHYSYHLGVGATYLLYRGLSINAEPIIQGAVTPISKHTPIETYPLFLGCSLGVSYHF